MNNADILGEEAAVRQIVENDFSATNGHFEDDTITNLRNNALRNKSNLKSVNFPNCTSFGNSVFYGCTQLENVYFDKVTTLQTEAFTNTKLSFVNETNFPSLVRVNNGNAFMGTKLTEFIAPKVTYIGSNTFKNVTTLLKIIMPIGGMRGACYGCTALKLVDILTGWGNDPGTLKSVATQSFYNCSSLVALILRNDTVVGLSNVDAFTGTKYAANGTGDAYVYVPRDLISSYQTATNWSTLYAAHSDMFRALEDYTVDGTTTGAFDESLLATPTNPMYEVTDFDVSVDENHQMYITTAADEGYITLRSGTFSSENWGRVNIQSDEVGRSLSGNYFTLPANATVKIIVKNMTATQWNSISGQRNQLSIEIRQNGASLTTISWSTLKQAFYTDGLKRYEHTYTNGNSNKAINSLGIYGTMTSNNEVSFMIRVLVNDVRVI